MLVIRKTLFATFGTRVDPSEHILEERTYETLYNQNVAKLKGPCPEALDRAKCHSRSIFYFELTSILCLSTLL